MFAAGIAELFGTRGPESKRPKFEPGLYCSLAALPAAELLLSQNPRPASVNRNNDNNSQPQQILSFCFVPLTSSSQLDTFHGNQNIFRYLLCLKQTE